MASLKESTLTELAATLLVLSIPIGLAAIDIMAISSSLLISTDF